MRTESRTGETANDDLRVRPSGFYMAVACIKFECLRTFSAKSSAKTLVARTSSPQDIFPENFAPRWIILPMLPFELHKFTSGMHEMSAMS